MTVREIAAHLVHRRCPRFGGAALAVGALVFGCGGDTLILPDEGAPLAIAVLSGDGQADTVGRPLADPLIVRITDSRNRPVQSQRVVFSATLNASNARLIPDTAITDADGQARTRWELATSTGRQVVRAQVLTSPAANPLFVDLSASATPDAPSALQLVSGDGQSAMVGSPLGRPLVVRVTDRYGNGLAGIPVTWRVSGGGSITPLTNGTDSSGIASARRTLGVIAGGQGAAATASGLGGGPVNFSHTATQGQAVALVADSGDHQLGIAGQVLPRTLVVRLVDASGNGVPGPSVAWAVATGGGSVLPLNGILDSGGRSATTWTLGALAGPNTVFASAGGFAVLFSATGTSALPARLVANSPTTLAGVAGAPVTPAPSVLVTDANGNPVGGVAVSFSVTAGGGTVAPSSASTDAAGIATVSAWTLGALAGDNTLSVSAAGASGPLAGSPVSFTATGGVMNATPAMIVITTQPSASAANTIPFATQPEIRVEDAGGNPLGGVAVSVAIAAGGGALSGSTTILTAASGLGTFSGLSLTGTVGIRTLRFSTGAVSATSATVSVAPGPVSPAHTIATVPNGIAGNTTTLSVRARDISDNSLTTGGATFQILVSGANSALPAVTDHRDGSYTAAYTPTAAGADAITIALGGSAIGGSPYGSAVSPGPVSASASTLRAAPATVPASAGATGSTLTLVAMDAFGNAIGGGSVTFAATTSKYSFVPALTTTNGSGQATSLFSSTLTGSRNITAKVNGVTVTQSPVVTVTPGVADAAHTVASVPSRGNKGQRTVITIQAQDQFGNPLTTGGRKVMVTVSGANAAGPLAATDNGDGSYTASYTPTKRGTDDIAITLDGAPIGGSPYQSKIH